jgi:hypothetical protein
MYPHERPAAHRRSGATGDSPDCPAGDIGRRARAGGPHRQSGLRAARSRAGEPGRQPQGERRYVRDGAAGVSAQAAPAYGSVERPRLDPVASGARSHPVRRPRHPSAAGRALLPRRPEIACPPTTPLPWLPIAPGESLFEAARLEYVPQRLPLGCADGILTEAINCLSRAIPAPRAYLIYASAATADCATTSCTPSLFRLAVGDDYNEECAA